MTPLQFTVEGATIPMLAEEPDTSAGSGVPAIVLLHGAGGNSDFWAHRLAPFLSGAHVALYAPQYFAKTQTGRADLATISDPHHVQQWLTTVREALRFVRTRPGVDPQRLVLAGISLGAFLALALAAELSASHNPAEQKEIRAVLAISGGLPAPYDRIATMHFPPTLIFHGEQDTVVPASFAHELDERLTALDVAHRTEIVPGEGHWFSAAAIPRLLLSVSGFLDQHLRPAAPRETAL